MKNKKIYESQIGITLIALIITIIVMLILSGISVMYLRGKSGILDQSLNAKQVTEQRQIEEEVTEKWYEVERKSVGNNYSIDEKMNMLRAKLDEGATVECISESGRQKLQVTYKGITVYIKI